MGILLQSSQGNRAMSGVLLINSVFLSSSDRDLRLPLKVQQGSQASSGVGAWNSAFLSSGDGYLGGLLSCIKGVKYIFAFQEGTW